MEAMVALPVMVVALPEVVAVASLVVAPPEVAVAPLVLALQVVEEAAPLPSDSRSHQAAAVHPGVSMVDL